ncbi:MAG TPA: FecR family protein, partial [Chitinophagaceae bacterium]
MNENPYSDMDKEAYRVAYLIAGYVRNTLTQNEHLELDDWVNANDHNMQLFEDLTDERNIEANLAMMDKVQSQNSFKQLQESDALKKPSRKIGLRKVWIAAACVVIISGVFLIYHYSGKGPTRNNELSITDSATLKPGGNRATLTLSNGSVIDLTTAKNGMIQNGEGSHVSKLADGELVYEKADSSKESVAMHTLSTPVGGKYQVTLPDGTKVWLNAATIIKYPSQFTGNERRVQLNGEAYFEVTRNEKQPFKVVLEDSSTVNVLGTHFNVMSYSNEDAKEVTLIEGSVSVKTNDNSGILEPGMQARINHQNITT